MDRRVKEHALNHSPFDDFLYDIKSKEQYDAISFLYAMPFFHQIIDWRMDTRATQEYMNRYGLDWSDLHDFRKLKNFGSQSSLVGSAYQMISKNIEDLYR